MKILKYLLYAVIALILIAVILGITGPKSYDVHRTAVVSGTPDQVWPYVSQLKNLNLWSPWAEKDTAMVQEYSGEDGTVGASVSWKGNDQVGTGSQTIAVVDAANKHFETTLKFMEPMEAEATSYTMLKDTAGGTLVTWGLKGENGFVGRIFATFMNMDKMMAPDFERGLTKLTELMAAAPKEGGASMDVIPGEFAGAKYLGVRGTMTFDKLEAFYEKSYMAIFPALEKAGAKPASAPSGLYYKWDEANMTTELAAAVAFTGDVKAPSGMEVIDVPAGKSLTINYMGGYNGMGKAHEAMDAYIQQNKLSQLAPVIEEYVTDPGTEPDSNKWLTKVVYLVK